jgi:dTDP-4-amino-4,6-dideoxygalactose transaminase
MDSVPFLDLKAQYRTIRSEVLPALEAVCESTAFAQGPAAKAFEEAFAAYCGVKHGVSLNSGTSALHVALRCLNVGPGDEVIVPAMTFVATAWAVSYCGATPVFVDIDPVRRGLDARKVAAAITSRTKAIMPVHLYGMPADMDAILAVAGKHGVPVVEDCAQAHGARYKGKRAGQFGVMAGFSFYPGKNLGAYGEGGAMVTNDEAYAARARRLRDHAQSQRYHHDEVGFNYRMDTFQGAVLGIKLKHLDAWNDARRRHARRYADLLRGLPLTLPATPADSDSVWHLYVIEVANRDTVRDKLAAAGIGCGLHYPIPVHLQKAYAELGYRKGQLPVAEALGDRCLSLPMYAELTEAQLETVAKALRRALA